MSGGGDEDRTGVGSPDDGRGDENAWDVLNDDELAYHLRQYDEPYRSTVAAIDFLAARGALSPQAAVRVLDVGCGAGANLHWIASRFPSAQLTGIDRNDRLIRAAAERNAGDARLRFVSGDFLATDWDTPFELVTAFQLLSWLPLETAGRVMDACCRCARDHVFVSSLFSEDDLQYLIRVDDRRTGKMHHYNVLSLEWVRGVAKRAGFALEAWVPFEIDIDLPRQEGLGSYTVATADGRRLQFSGSLHMPWFFLLFSRSGDGGLGKGKG